MRLGVVIPQMRPWKELARDFAWAEDVGYDVAYVYDHLTHPTAAGGWLADGFSILAAAATSTSRVGLGTLVASATLHSPVALARLAATTDDIADGRLVLGLGAGSPRCSNADRGEAPTPGEMHRRLADVVEGLVAVFEGATHWQGATRSFGGLETTATPSGAGTPYLMLAAHGPKGMDLTVRHADAWNTNGGPGSVELAHEAYWDAVRIQGERFTEACERVGRDPDQPRRTLLLGYGTIRPTTSSAAYDDAIGRAHEEGFDELIVYGPFGESGGRFWSDPEVHGDVLARHRATA